MNEKCVKELFNSMIINEKLWGIKYINLQGATVTSSTIELITKYMKNARKAEKSIFNYFNIGVIKSGVGDLISKFMKYDVPVKRLFLRGTKFDSKAEESLLNFIDRSIGLFYLVRFHLVYITGIHRVKMFLYQK